MNNDFTSAIDQIVNQMIAEGRGNDIGAFREKCMKLKVKSAHTAWLAARRMFGIKAPAQELPGIPAKFRY